jgi:hypothetical protein
VIPGYLDGFFPPVSPSTLVDGAPFLADDQFWPVFLAFVGAAETAPDAFGVDPADLEQFFAELRSATAWPVFSLPVAGGHRIDIVLRNFDDDAGVDYVLVTGDRHLSLAAIEGHFRGPALSWPELVAVAGGDARRLLLLLPAYADGDRPADAADVVAAALIEVGAATDVDELAEELLTIQDWDEDTRWHSDGDVVVCLGDYAYRAPGSMTRDDLRLVTEAFSSSR